MEHKYIENIDIEKSKELFEYEMTEVILKLKGEFAKVSEKDSKYEQAAVDDEKLKVTPVSVHKVTLEQKSVELPKLKKAEKVEIGSFSVSKNVTDIPAVPSIKTIESSPVNVELAKLDLPKQGIHKNNKTDIKVEIKKAEVNIPAIRGIVVPEAAKPEVEKKLAKVSVPAIRGIVVPEVTKPVIEKKVIKVDVVHKPVACVKKDVDLPVTKVDMPKITAVKKYSKESVTKVSAPEITVVNTDIHEIKSGETVEITRNATSVPTIKNFSKQSSVSVSVPKVKVQIPAIEKFDFNLQNNVEAKAENENASGIAKVKAAEKKLESIVVPKMKDLSIKQVTLSEKHVTVPNSSVNLEPCAELNISVKPYKIDVDDKKINIMDNINKASSAFEQGTNLPNIDVPDLTPVHLGDASFVVNSDPKNIAGVIVPAVKVAANIKAVNIEPVDYDSIGEVSIPDCVAYEKEILAALKI